MKKSAFFRLFLCLLLCTALLVPTGALPVPAAAETDIQVFLSVDYKQADAREMLTDINAFRTGGDAWYWNSSNTQKTPVGKLAPLSYSYDLEKVAMQRAAEIVLTFEHTRPNGNSCFTTAGELGVNPGNGAAENIAAGYPTADSVYIGWQEDDRLYEGQGHRRNMLGNYTHVGIAHAVVNGVDYWVQEFGNGSTVGQPNSDGHADVSIPVAEKRVLSFIPDHLPALFLSGGEQKTLPDVTATISFAQTWVYTPTVTVRPRWTAPEGGNTVFLKDGNITGHVAGSVNLAASLFGETVLLPVTVTSTAHSFGEWIPEKQPNCTENGSASRKCSLCGESETKPLPALGHDYRETVAADGSKSFVCSRCGIVRTFLPGDVNGDGKVNSADRTALARHLANWSGYSLAEISGAAADVNGDGKINSADRTALARALANWSGYIL